MNESPPLDVQKMMSQLGANARRASRNLAIATPSQKRLALTTAADAIRNESAAIERENQIDLAEAKKRELSKAMIDRLELNGSRIEAMARGLCEIAKLDDPVGAVIAKWDRPNGLADRTGSHAARCDRRDLRKSPQRDRRCRSTVHDGRQCGDFAWRQ